MDIYEPREDSFFMETFAKKYCHGRVCDMGSGSGILALAAAKKAKEVFAVDVNPEATEAIRKQVRELKIRNVQVILSHFFSGVPKGILFDIIVCNPPYLPSDERVPDVALDGGKHGYEWILRFLAQAKHRLTKDGIVLLLFSSLSKKDVIDKALDKDAWKRELMGEKKLDFETLYVYKLSRRNIAAKGRRGMVSLEAHDGKKIMVKERNPSSAKDSLAFEADMLRKVNRIGIGPRFIFFREGRLGMEYIDGKRIIEYLKGASAKKAKAVLRNILEQCFLLDKEGIVKEEMTNPYKHIIVRKGIPVFIDFERARCRGKAQNVTQAVQFFQSESMRNALGKRRLAEVSLSLLQEYKKRPSRTAFLRILAQSDLASFNERCYALLSLVPQGKVTTYGAIAHALGTGASRAVGNAMNKNPYAPEIPCHRVVNSDGKVGGFAGGTNEKIRMLEKEGIHVKGGRILSFEKVSYALA
jgi:HemK-related putative methylase